MTTVVTAFNCKQSNPENSRQKTVLNKSQVLQVLQVTGKYNKRFEEVLRPLCDHNCSRSNCAFYLTIPKHIFFITTYEVAYFVKNDDKRN